MTVFRLECFVSLIHRKFTSHHAIQYIPFNRLYCLSNVFFSLFTALFIIFLNIFNQLPTDFGIVFNWSRLFRATALGFCCCFSSDSMSEHEVSCSRMHSQYNNGTRTFPLFEQHLNIFDGNDLWFRVIVIHNWMLRCKNSLLMHFLCDLTVSSNVRFTEKNNNNNDRIIEQTCCCISRSRWTFKWFKWD